MKRSILVVLLLAMAILGAYAPTTSPPSVMLAWSRSQDSSVNGYRVYWGVVSRVYTNSIDVSPETATTIVISNLVRNTTYYFAATALATNGLESAYSSEATYRTSPLPPPPEGFTATTQNP